jgi:hypothetical protein
MPWGERGRGGVRKEARKEAAAAREEKRQVAAQLFTAVLYVGSISTRNSNYRNTSTLVQLGCKATRLYLIFC